MNDLLILVDENDNETGSMSKLAVHQSGELHRAFSLFIFNQKGEILLQQRADEKYHSAGLWSNTCCSHPKKGEQTNDAVARRLKEEMGMECATQFQFSFIYKAALENGLTEHELDHVYFGESDAIPIPDPGEVKDWKYIRPEKLKEEIIFHPNKYSAWLKICFPKVESILLKNSIFK
ncbi:MAG: isopentenyl-diphosphate Delta-isomerase [Ginsengibacter sp.]